MQLQVGSVEDAPRAVAGQILWAILVDPVLGETAIGEP
jgi:hypothetical protein